MAHAAEVSCAHKGRLCLSRSGPQEWWACHCPYRDITIQPAGQGKAEGRAELAVFVGQSWRWAYITVSVGLYEATRPWLTSREAGDAVPAVCPGGKEVGLEDS